MDEKAKKAGKFQIRNSTADFLIFTRDAGESGIEVRVQNGTVWLTQKAMAELYGVDRSVVTKHLNNVFAEGEISEISTCAIFAQTAADGKNYQYKFYALPAIIAVGYRINSSRAAQFRRWATGVLEAFAESEFEQYRQIQDRLYKSDFDKLVEACSEKEK